MTAIEELSKLHRQYLTRLEYLEVTPRQKQIMAEEWLARLRREARSLDFDLDEGPQHREWNRIVEMIVQMDAAREVHAKLADMLGMRALYAKVGRPFPLRSNRDHMAARPNDRRAG